MRRPSRAARELLLRPRVAVDVPGRRARRPALRRCALAAGRRRRPCRAARDLAAQRGAVEDRAGELRMPLVWPEEQPVPGRSACASPPLPSSAAAPPSSSSRPAAWPSAAATTSTTPRSWPRRPPPPASASKSACTPRGELRRDGADGAGGAATAGQGADALPVLVVGRALFCGEHRLRRGGRRRERARAARPPARRSLRRLRTTRADAPGRIQGDAQGPAAAPLRPARARATRAWCWRSRSSWRSSWSAAACCCSTSTSTSRWTPSGASSSCRRSSCRSRSAPPCGWRYRLVRPADRWLRGERTPETRAGRLVGARRPAHGPSALRARRCRWRSTRSRSRSSSRSSSTAPS